MPYAVAVYLWGRDVSAHTVYVGECPYRFAMGDIQAIEATLAWYTPVYVRHVLPLTVPLSALHNLGMYQMRPGQHDTVVCVIGDAPAQEEA